MGKSWVSEPILPLLGLQSRICFGQVQWKSREGCDSARQWGCCCQSYRSMFFFLEAVCIIQFVLLQVIYALVNEITVMREQQQLIYQHFGKVWFQDSAIYLSSFTIVVLSEKNVLYLLYVIVSLLCCLCCYPDTYSHTKCFQDSFIDCNTSINSLLVKKKKILNPC